MPPEMYDRIRGVALNVVRQDPQFALLYKKFYEPQFGPLDVRL